MTFSGSLNKKVQSKGFSLSVGAGMTSAKLSFSKCSSLNLSLDAKGGGHLASTAGPSVVLLDQPVAAGTYTYVVSGNAQCSFTLVVTAAP